MKNVVVFATGTHNGQSFDGRDLENIVSAFNALNMSGQIALKFGHGDEGEQPFREGLPALGWVTRLARDGDRLVADFEDIPEAVEQAIRSGRYRFTSVELLRDVTDSSGKRWPWVLDAIALLGSEAPAVRSVSDLKALVAARMQNAAKFSGGTRLTFACAPGKSETEELRAQLAEANAAMIAMTFENAITAGRIRPADREAFNRRYGADGSLDEARAWIANSPKPIGFGRTTLATPVDGVISGRPDDAMVAVTRKIMARERALGDRLDFASAAAIAVRENPDLARSWGLQNGEA